MVLEEMSKCTGCGKPRFTPGLCQACNQAQYITTQAYNKISEASDLLTGLYDYNSMRVDEIANKLAEAQEQVLQAEHQIRELQTQINLQKGINADQKEKLDEIKEYAEDQRYNNPTVSWTMRNILKLKDCPVCAKLKENCTCCNYCLNHECGICPQHGEFHSGRNPKCGCGKANK